MQNRYVGDVGDFGKYGLLRALCCTDHENVLAQLQLGIVWYLFPDEDHNLDGKYISYLTPNEKNLKDFRACDPSLFDALSVLIRNDSRNVRDVAESGIFPPSTVFFDNVLSFHGLPKSGKLALEQRLDHRADWLSDALSQTTNCDLVFLDPDNGFEVKSRARHHDRGPKHVFFDEVSPFIERQQSVVVYHHIGRHGTSAEQVKRLNGSLKVNLNIDDPLVLLYRRGTQRAFFIIPSEIHRRELNSRALRFSKHPVWQRHFDLINA